MQEITAEVDYLIQQGLTPQINNTDKRNNEIQRIVSLEAKNFLNSTDWYVIRKMETGAAIPSDIIAKRAMARSLASN
jgi:hypothetical protein